jgi:hypothetical protein
VAVFFAQPGTQEQQVQFALPPKDASASASARSARYGTAPAVPYRVLYFTVPPWCTNHISSQHAALVVFFIDNHTFGFNLISTRHRMCSACSLSQIARVTRCMVRGNVMCVLECMARGDSLCSRTVMSKPGDETWTQTQTQTYAVSRHSVPLRNHGRAPRDRCVRAGADGVGS